MFICCIKHSDELGTRADMHLVCEGANRCLAHRRVVGEGSRRELIGDEGILLLVKLFLVTKDLVGPCYTACLLCGQLAHA